MQSAFELCLSVDCKANRAIISWETKTDEDTTQGVGIIIMRILASVTTQMLVEKLGNFTCLKNIFLKERDKIGNSFTQT